ncbi:MAG: hypothetical protein ABJN35_14155 [Erythrobacter sp.]
MREKLAVSVGAIALSLAGCASTAGQNFDTARVSEMRIGQTTPQQTIAALGEPYSRNIAIDGSEQWMYFLAKGKSRITAKHFIPFVGPFMSGASEAELEQKTLNLSFANGVLASCKLTLRNSAGSGDGVSGAGAIAEVMSSGTTQETDCG